MLYCIWCPRDLLHTKPVTAFSSHHHFSKSMVTVEQVRTDLLVQPLHKKSRVVQTQCFDRRVNRHKPREIIVENVRCRGAVERIKVTAVLPRTPNHGFAKIS